MKNLNALIEKYRSLILTNELNNEEAVKNYIVRNMVERVWLYEYGAGVDCYKVEVELPQIGSKVNHSRCDYLLQTANYKCVIEAKSLSESIDNSKHVDELASYVQNLLADMAILTNGRKWSLYLAGANHVMEKTPFKIIDFDTIAADEKQYILDLFKKPGASLVKIKSAYEEGKKKAAEQNLMTRIENEIIEERKYLAEEEKKNIIRKIEQISGVTQNKLESYEKYFQAAMMNVVEKEKAKYREEVKAELARYVNKIEDAEREVYCMVQGMLSEKYEGMDVNLQDFESGVGAKIHFNGPKSGQPILWICGKIEDNKYKFAGIAFAKSGTSVMGDVIPMMTTKDVLAQRTRILAEAELSAKGPRKAESVVTEKLSTISSTEV